MQELKFLLLTNSYLIQQHKDILELLELRYDSHTTIIALQFTLEKWHKNLGGEAIAYDI